MIAEQDDDYRAYYSDEELAETPAERMARLAAKKAAKTLPKGTCPKCMKHIGKGIYFHTRSCKG